jgi:hypothetical protein
MKKKFLAGLATGLLMVGMAGVASAASFSVTDDYNDVYKNGIGYDEITDSFLIEFTMPMKTPPDTLTSATLTLHHNGNSWATTNNNSAEVWFTYASNSPDILIGTLSSSPGQIWTTDTWTLSAAVLSLIQSGTPNWKLSVKLFDTTPGADKINLDYATLAGDYTPGQEGNGQVPEPATMLLFGAGLIGLAGFGRRKLSK